MNTEISLTEPTTKKRRVMIGTPSYDGNVSVWYINSLINTIKLAENYNVEIIPIWVSFDALIQRARNDTVAFAVEHNCDDLIWIDADIEWQPEWFFKLLEHPVDVVGGTYSKKNDQVEQYVLNLGSHPGVIDSTTGLMQVAGLGTGFLRFSQRAFQWVWDNSTPYIDPDKGNREKRWIFDVVVRNNNVISEDIWVCTRLVEEGKFDIYLDTTMTCGHVGGKKYDGNFLNWFDKIVKSAKYPSGYTRQY